jgi:hypothetical protein
MLAETAEILRGERLSSWRRACPVREFFLPPPLFSPTRKRWRPWNVARHPLFQWQSRVTYVDSERVPSAIGTKHKRFVAR